MPELDHVSYSSLSRHRSCPQKWAYGAIAKLERIEDDDPAVARDFGSWWHSLMAADALERGRALGSLRYVPKEVRSVTDGPVWAGDQITPEEVLQDARVWWKNSPVEVTQKWEESLGVLPDRLAEVYADWLEQWFTERLHEQPLAVEMRWERTLPDLSTEVVGYVDEIYLDTQRDMAVVRDHKTALSLPTGSTSLSDMMDSQLQLYAWGAAPEVTSWGVGKLRATSYDRVRSNASKTPKLTLRGSLSKSVKDYNLSTYQKWVKGEHGAGVSFPGATKDGSGAGFYVSDPDVVAHLSSLASRSIWFQRTLTPVNLHLVKSHLRAAQDSAEDMNSTWERFERSGEAPRNLGQACKWCDFAGLCRAQMTGGPTGDYVLEEFGLRATHED